MKLTSYVYHTKILHIYIFKNKGEILMVKWKYNNGLDNEDHVRNPK